jgi:NTP pyrophosphatase (non-canonical NTP hydrolase)
MSASMDKQIKEVFCIAQEECAEVTQAISKIFRFGFDSKNPQTNKSNKQCLEEEVGDLLAMVDIMVEKCIISDSSVNAARKAKREKLKVWSNIEV